MGATTTYGWRIPELSDPANAPADFQAGLQDVEDTVKDTALTSYTPAWTSNGAVQPGGNVTKTGRYRLDHGRCSIWLSLVGGAAPNGGTGDLFIGLPIAPRSDMTWQYMPAWFWSPYAGGGAYAGLARPLAGQLAMPIYLPVGASDGRLNPWRNAVDGNTPGTGVPVIPSWYGVVTGFEVVVAGSYFV